MTVIPNQFSFKDYQKAKMASFKNERLNSSTKLSFCLKESYFSHKRKLYLFVTFNGLKKNNAYDKEVLYKSL